MIMSARWLVALAPVTLLWAQGTPVFLRCRPARAAAGSNAIPADRSALMWVSNSASPGAS